MSAFKEVLLPEEISAWLIGGPQWSTQIAANQGGFEQRSQLLVYPLHRWDMGTGNRELRLGQATKAFQMRMRGRAYGFRVKDPLDHDATAMLSLLEPGVAVQGVLVSLDGTSGGIGDGAAVYQLHKAYVTDDETFLRKITKPAWGSVIPYRNGAPVTAGAGPGNYALDETTGIVTLVADAQSAVTGITPGATTEVTLSAPIIGLSVAGKLYLSGVDGPDAALLNGQAHTITAIAGPLITLATDTAGKGLAAGAGVGYKYPQPSDSLTWSGDFHVPVRFDNDWLRLGVDSGGLLSWESVSLMELRNP